MCNVTAYYKFQRIPDPQGFCDRQKDVCRGLGLRGRVYVAQEGINGTLAGSAADIEEYQNDLRGQPGFADIIFKDQACPCIPFDRLIVKTRPEIVALKTDVNPAQGGRYLTPQQWRDVLESDEGYVLIDVRNDYETRIGHFAGALLPEVANFYEFPEWLERNSFDRNKKILMYCTGGIRCEKFSAHMIRQGYHDVNQLQGGILNYAQDQGGAHFQGKCFVFDDRLAVDVSPRAETIGRCEISGEPCDTYINCANLDCNKLFICSRAAAVQMEGCCSDACRQAQWRKPFNPDDIYTPTRRWYNYFADKTAKALR